MAMLCPSSALTTANAEQLLAAAAAIEVAEAERIRIGAALQGGKIERMILWYKQSKAESEQESASREGRLPVVIPAIPTSRDGVYEYFNYLYTVAAGRHTTGDHAKVFSPLAKGVANEIFNRDTQYMKEHGEYVNVITWQDAHNLCHRYFLDREFEGHWSPKRNKPEDLMEVDDILYWLGH